MLEELFGRGTDPLRLFVLERLYSRLGLEFKQKEGLSFEDYVDITRKTFKEAQMRAHAGR